MAVVVLRGGVSQFGIERLGEFCADRLARFKIPRYLRIVDRFPMTVTGKIRKDVLRQQATGHLEGD